MIIILGLIILVAALVVAVAGVLGNGGSAHAVSHFSVLGYHFTGSAGTLFLLGIVVGDDGNGALRLLGGEDGVGMDAMRESGRTAAAWDCGAIPAVYALAASAEAFPGWPEGKMQVLRLR